MKYSEEKTIRVSAYTHNLNKSLVQAFVRMTEVYIRTKQSVNIADEKTMNLSFSQRTNFQKLQYFDLVKKIPSKAGYIPTLKGLNFFFGRVQCFDIVATIGKIILPYSHHAWETHSVEPQLKFIWEYLGSKEFQWKQKEEYQHEKDSAQTLLFNF